MAPDSSIPDEVIDLLKSYLIESRAESKRLSKLAEKLDASEDKFSERVQGIFAGQSTLSNQVAALSKSLEHMHEDHKNRFAGIEARVTRLEEDREATGRHELAELKRRTADETTWLKRYGFQTLVLILGFILSTLVSYVIVRKG